MLHLQKYDCVVGTTVFSGAVDRYGYVLMTSMSPPVVLVHVIKACSRVEMFNETSGTLMTLRACTFSSRVVYR